MRRPVQTTLLFVVAASVAWGGPKAMPGSTPTTADQEVRAVSVGPQHGCGIRGDGTVWCWGKEELASPPDGVFRQISAGASHTCALDERGQVTCWGSDERGPSGPPENIAGQAFIQISAGAAHTCGVLEDGSVRCWGCRDRAAANGVSMPRDSGQCTPPEGTFIEVSAGQSHTCGIRTDGTAACWGRNSSGCATPPDGKFVQLSATEYRTCGVRTDGTLICWGRNAYGESTTAEGRFKQVATGAWHTCGLRSDGEVSCWGNDRRGQCDAPGGAFTTISAGGEHACGLTGDGTLVCWGDNLEGQSSPYVTPPATDLHALVERATRDPDPQQKLAVVLLCPSRSAPGAFRGLATIRVTPGRKLNLVDDWGQHSRPTLVHEQELTTEQYTGLLEALLSVDWTVSAAEPSADLQVTHRDRAGALNLKLPAEPLCSAAWNALGR